MIAARRLSRLLVLLPSTRMGGTEGHTAILATHLATRTGIALDLAAEPALHAALAAMLPVGVKLHAAALGWDEPGEREENFARQGAETRRLLAALRPDAAFVPLPWPDAGHGALPVLAEADMPRLVLLHLAPEAPPPDSPPVLRLENAVLAAVSAPVARRAEVAWGRPAASVAVLPNPAPGPGSADPDLARASLRAALGLPPGSKLLLFVGRLEEAKGADLLPAISDRLPMTLAVAGDGPLRASIEAHASADPRGLLRVLGPVGDPAPWYFAADALVLPSRLEGAPLVFLEAAAHRCPVVATELALEALGDDAHCLARIAATPDARSIAEAVSAALHDGEGTAERVRKAAIHAARHDWRRATDAALGLLRAAALKVGGRIAA
jgi:glycosyltransferase involved in cell wall biosynthesis